MFTKNPPALPNLSDPGAFGQKITGASNPMKSDSYMPKPSTDTMRKSV